MSTSRQYCTFFLGDGLFGVHVDNVQEIIRNPEITRLPLVPHVVRGLMNLRGQIVTAFDLRGLLGLDRAGDEIPHVSIGVFLPGGVVSLIVDRIGDVLEVPVNQFEEPPRTLEGVAKELIQGAYKLEDRLLLVLDVERAISTAMAGNS